MPRVTADSSERARRIERLAGARLYLCTPRPLCPAGVDLVQLRSKGLEWREETAELARLTALAAATGALVSANDRADLAHFTGVDVLHVGQDDIPPRLAREMLGPDVLIGLSSHDPAQLEAAAADPDVDYFCVGPVWETPTKQGRPGVGLGLLELAVHLAPPFTAGVKPWFVTGGIDAATLDDVLATGARRVVVVRAITQAAPLARTEGGADQSGPERVATELAAPLRAA